MPDSASNDVAILEIVKPRRRFVRVVIDRGTANAVIDGAFALQTRAGEEPVTHDATTVVGSEVHLAPAIGTP